MLYARTRKPEDQAKPSFFSFFLFFSYLGTYSNLPVELSLQRYKQAG